MAPTATTTTTQTASSPEGAANIPFVHLGKAATTTFGGVINSGDGGPDKDPSGTLLMAGKAEAPPLR